MSRMWSEEGRILSGEQNEPKRRSKPKSQGRSNPNLSSVQAFNEPKEATEGIWCRTCGNKYSGSMSEHVAAH